MDSRQALALLKEVEVKIKEVLLRTSGDGDYREYDENIEYGSTPDERLCRNEIYRILEKLDLQKDKISYLNKQIIVEGTLHKNENNYYELVSASGEVERVYHCGDKIEALVPDDEEYTWVISRVEHNGADYYIVGDSKVSMQGLRARLR